MTTRASSSRMEKTTKKSKKSSKRVQRMDDVRIEDEDEAREYERLMGLSHHTRWLDWESIQKMCMDEALTRCYSTIGLNVLLRCNNTHFPALTSEFMATFKCTYEGVESDGIISFQLGNELQELSLRNLAVYLGFPFPRDEAFVDNEKVDYLWKYIAGRSEMRKGASTNEIANPLFRVMIRALGCSIFARHELSKPMKEEAMLLYEMLFEHEKSMNLTWEWVKMVRDFQSSSWIYF